MGQFEDDDNSDSEEDNVPSVVGVPLSSSSITIVPVTPLPSKEVTAPSCNLDVLDSAPQHLTAEENGLLKECMKNDHLKVKGRVCWKKVQEAFSLRINGVTIYSRTARRLQGSAKTTLLLKRRRLQDEPDTGPAVDDQILPNTSLVIPVLNDVNEVQASAVTTTVIATTVTAEMATTVTLPILTTVAANIRPANSTKHVLKGISLRLKKNL